MTLAQVLAAIKAAIEVGLLGDATGYREEAEVALEEGRLIEAAFKAALAAEWAAHIRGCWARHDVVRDSARAAQYAWARDGQVLKFDLAAEDAAEQAAYKRAHAACMAAASRANQAACTLLAARKAAANRAAAARAAAAGKAWTLGEIISKP